MPAQAISCRPFHNWKQFSRLALALLCLLVTCREIHGFDGFTEPYRTVRVAAPESGIISECFIEEGDRISQGDPLVRLDTDVHEALLAIAKSDRNARGRLDAAQAEVHLRRNKLSAFEELRQSGHARQEELDRARADLEVALGQLAATEEAQQIKELEYDKIVLQIARRTIRAPLDGVVTEIFKQPGEFSAANDPNLLVVVQLNPLLASFDLLTDEARDLEVGATVSVTINDTDEVVEGTVEYVSPVVNAESGTVLVKIKIPNADLRYQAGRGCSLNL